MTTQCTSETLRVMHDIIAKIPADVIYMPAFRAEIRSIELNPWENAHEYKDVPVSCDFRSTSDCGSHGCAIGWAATSAELAPVQEDYRSYDGDYSIRLNWDRYAARILHLDKLDPAKTCWAEYEPFRYLFTETPYNYLKPASESLKEEILRRLRMLAVDFHNAESNPDFHDWDNVFRVCAYSNAVIDGNPEWVDELKDY